MYAIFETGAKQYKVSAGDVIRIEKIAGEAGDSVKFGNVIVFSEGGGKVRAGTPYLDATVNATIVGAGRGEKVIVFKFKAKKDYRKKQGHRQPYTEVEIDNFTVGGKDFGEKPEKPVAVEAAAEETGKAKAAEEKPAAPAKKKAKAKAEAEPVIEEPADEPAAEETAAANEPANEPVDEATEAVNEAAVEPVAVEPTADEPAAEETAAEAKAGAKLTKADIMEKLDALGVHYSKNAKKDELLGLLDEAEGK